MKMPQIKVLIVFFFIAVTGVSCVQLKQQTTKSEMVVPYYNPGKSIIHPSVFIYHKNNTTSRLYCRLNMHEFLFDRENVGNKLRARIHIAYKIYNSVDRNNVIGSDTADIRIDSVNQNNILTSYVRIKKEFSGKKFMEVRISDPKRGSETLRYLVFDKSSKYNTSNFLVRSAQSLKPLFRNFIGTGEKFLIRYRSKPKKDLFMNYYSETLGMPAPPYSKSEDQKIGDPDSLKKISAAGAQEHSLNQEGIYRFRIDTSQGKGITLLNFGKYYPQIKTPRQMIAPLRYLTTPEEFKKLKNAENPKLAIDKFWLNKAGSVSEAKELIKIYYMRITFSNKYFTALSKGWKTDRGMIYTVLGPPHAVKKTMDSEVWLYSNTDKARNMSFKFVKSDTPLSDNQYILKRKVPYESVWSEAVKKWRNGKVFSY